MYQFYCKSIHSFLLEVCFKDFVFNCFRNQSKIYLNNLNVKNCTYSNSSIQIYPKQVIFYRNNYRWEFCNYNLNCCNVIGALYSIHIEHGITKFKIYPNSECFPTRILKHCLNLNSIFFSMRAKYNTLFESLINVLKLFNFWQINF